MEESSITCAKFINADIALVICAPERGTVSPNFPHLLSPDQQGDSSCSYRPCGVLCQSFLKRHASFTEMAWYMSPLSHEDQGIAFLYVSHHNSIWSTL